MDKTKEPPFEMKNGKKLYRMQFRVDSQMRAVQQPAGKQQVNNAAGADPGTEGAGEEVESAERPSGAADEVRVRCRLLSAVDTWSWHDWYGPCFVRNGHNDAFALRKVPGLINAAKRPTPLMWNHSDDMKDKAGIVEKAAWEDSTDIPPGVNADLVVLPGYDEKAANGLKLGVIDATSISWFAIMERSHPDLSFSTFMDMQGKELDGEIVAWWAVDCVGVEHHAMVPAGADPDSGPRSEQRKSAGLAAQNSSNMKGEERMDIKVLLALALAWCKELGFDVALVPGEPIPEGLQQRGVEQIRAMKNVGGQYNEQARGLQNLAAGVMKEGEASLTAAQVLERMPARLEDLERRAKYGDAFLKNQQDDAVKWFDKAYGDPENPENFTDVQKRQRERLAACADLAVLADAIVDGQEKAKARFGNEGGNRTSAGEEVPADKTVVDGEANRIAAQMKRWQGEPKK